MIYDSELATNLHFRGLKTDLIVDDEVVWIFRQKVPELLDVLPGNVPDFRWGLRSVPEQALDRDLGADAVLEIKNMFSLCLSHR